MQEHNNALPLSKTDTRTSRSQRVTINDLAQELGLAKGTVSRALNGYPDIAQRTVLRVKKTAEKMGYAPLAHAQAIRTGSSRALALVLHTGEPDAQRPFLAGFIAGITTAASQEHWSLTVATAKTDDEMLTTMRRLIREGKADGFILPRTKTLDSRIDLCRSEGVPFILFGRTGEDQQCAWFDFLGEDAVSGAVKHLFGLGHVRMGFINGPAEFNFSRLRERSFLNAVSEFGVSTQTDIVRSGATTPDEAEKLAKELLTHSEPPTAIVCATDHIALGVYHAAEALGLKVGEDIATIGYGGAPEGSVARPGLTTYEVDNRLAGERLAKMLIQLIRGATPEHLRETAPAQLITRGSDGPMTLSSEELRARILIELVKVCKPREELI